MRIRSLFIAGLIMFGLSSVAQDNVKHGIRAGWQSAGTYTEGKAMGDPISTFYIGFEREHKIVPLLHWGAGLEYFQNGYKIDDDNYNTVHTISVPLHLKLRVGPVYGLGGLGANFKVGEKLMENGAEVDSERRGIDIPAFAGVGVKILRVNLEFRYHWGLMGIYPDQDSPNNQYLQAGIGISL